MRKRAAQVLAITHGLREELVPVVLESSAAEGGDDEEWHDRLLEMSAEEVKLLAAEAEQTLLLCATIDEKLEAASAALLSERASTRGASASPRRLWQGPGHPVSASRFPRAPAGPAPPAKLPKANIPSQRSQA